MKKNLIFLAVLFVALSFGFASCENPDDNEELLNRIEQLENQLKDQQSGKDEDKTDSADKDGDKDNSSDNEQNGEGTPEPGEGDGEEETPTPEEPVTFTLVLLSSDEAMGTVSEGGVYDKNAEVTITATPKPGFKFVKWNDGNTDNPRTVIVNEDITYTAIFEIIVSGTENGFGYIDLGLSVKWATCNVGATKPEEYGNYYAWGEVEPKTTYSWSTYKWMTIGMSSWTGVNKYTFADGLNEDYDVVWYDNSGNFIGDNKTVLDPEDDAATVNMGGSWRMPTAEEQQELIDECTWTWTTLNGVNGYNVEGPNGNSIFLPAAGYRGNSDLYSAGSDGYYWSSSLYTSYSDNAYNLYFYSDSVYWYGSRRYYGRSVRGVCP